MAINHYAGRVKIARSAKQLGTILKDSDYAAERWSHLVAGDCTFHDHAESKVCHQLWTHDEPDAVACQVYVGYW